MTDLATEHDIATVPKVELHVHLNGTISEATAATLARRHRADPDETLILVDGQYPGHGLFPSLDAHPVAAFWRAGVNMTISSDDPPFFRTMLTDELQHIVRLGGLTRRDLGELQRRAARAAFATAETKAEIIAKIDAWEAAA